MSTHPAVLLQDLIRINTSGVSGGGGSYVDHVRDVLAAAGISAKVLGTEHSPSLVARIPGCGYAPPVLLYTHPDLVGVSGQHWWYPPYEGASVNGEIWGRGAAGAKGALAMMLAALLELSERHEPPAGEIVLVVATDQTTGEGGGAEFLVREHPELFDGIRCGIGDDGGVEVDLGGARFHPVVVAEKRAVRLRLHLRGAGGSAAQLAPQDSAMTRLGEVLTALSGVRLPRHLTLVADRALATLTAGLPQPAASVVARLRRGGFRDDIPTSLPLAEALLLDSLLRHTITPTIIHTTGPIDLLPTEITVDLDGRVLPGDFSAAHLVEEMRDLVGDDVLIDVLAESEPVPPDMSEPQFGRFYGSVVDVLRRFDPQATPLPMLGTACTEARLYGQLGIRCYGWIPLRTTTSGYRRRRFMANERVPADALEFGAECLRQLLLDYR